MVFCYLKINGIRSQSFHGNEEIAGMCNDVPSPLQIVYDKILGTCQAQISASGLNRDGLFLTHNQPERC